MWALFVTFLDISVIYFHPFVASWIVEIFGLLLLIPFVVYYREKILSESKRTSKNMFLLIFFLSILSSIAAVSFTFAFSLWSLAIVSAIAACSPAVTTLLSIIFDWEKLENIQYIAIWILIFWVVGLSYFSI